MAHPDDRVIPACAGKQPWTIALKTPAIVSSLRVRGTGSRKISVSR